MRWLSRLALLVGALWLCIGNAFALPPDNGWWWNSSESGSGYAIERQGNSIFMAAFLYEASGAATWYATLLALQPDGTYKGDMNRYVGGKSLLGSYKAPNPPTAVATAAVTFPYPNSGTMTISFANGSPTRTIAIRRFGFSSPVFEPSRASFQNGWYWNDQESGTGYFIEVQGSNAFIASFMYDTAGQPTWYASVATLSGTNSLSGPLDMYSNGQSLGGAYKAPAVNAGGAGTMKYGFSGGANGSMTLPNNTQVAIKRFVFDPKVVGNNAPVPNAGVSQTVTVGDTVYLNGSGTDADNDPLTFSWNWLSWPTDSSTSLYNWQTTKPYFVPALAGVYRLELMADDGKVSNGGSVVTVTANPKVVTNLPPIANAGSNQSVSIGQTAYLNGSASYDPNGDSLTYLWSGYGPAGTKALIYNNQTSVANINPDLPGEYGFTLVVNDGKVNSSPSSVTVTAIAAPNVNGVNTATNCAYPNTSTGNDPLLAYQWHIKNNNYYFASNNPAYGLGVDLCMGNLWASGINGTGVKVNVVDSGLEIAHQDLASRIVPGGSYNFLTSSTDPTNTDKTGDHGTKVSGLIAASKDNGIGGSGIAPKANLQGYNLLSATQNYTNYSISFGANNTFSAANSDIFNISAGSYSSTLSSPNTQFDSIFFNITNLRSGKGAVLVRTAGNGFQGLKSDDPGKPAYCQDSGVTCQNINQDSNKTIYNAIVVAALNADGTKSSYSTTGSAIWVSGFGGEYGYDASVVSVKDPTDYKPAMLTTDQSSCSAGASRSGFDYNLLDKGNGSGIGNSTCDYTATFNGTSAASPTVAGVVALILQANPALTWRDVRHILATTARRVNPTQTPITNLWYFDTPFVLEQGWVLNAGGYWYHNWYGFGLVNAAAAVSMAQKYVAGNLGNFISQTLTSAVGDTSIAPSSIAGLTKTFIKSGNAPITVEQAELMLYFGESFEPFCVQIELTSPLGTKSIVMNSDSAHTSASTSGVRFLSNAFYGEPATGNWTLRFINSCTSAVQRLSSTTAQKLTIRGR
jgi:subtilisin family serine protease